MLSNGDILIYQCFSAKYSGNNFIIINMISKDWETLERSATTTTSTSTIVYWLAIFTSITHEFYNKCTDRQFK